MFLFLLYSFQATREHVVQFSLATLSDRALIVVTARVDYRTVHGKEPQPLPRADINCTRLAMKLIVAAKDASCEAS